MNLRFSANRYSRVSCDSATILVQSHSDLNWHCFCVLHLEATWRASHCVDKWLLPLHLPVSAGVLLLHAVTSDAKQETNRSGRNERQSHFIGEGALSLSLYFRELASSGQTSY